MDEFQLDAELLATLKGVRESVRQLFEQLRLKNESGDISGKERLERVPAFAKRNFANLTNATPHLAIKEAWRLVDFLEGKDAGQLSRRARDALRVVELDKKLVAFRASERWNEAAARLREALGVSPEGGQETADSIDDVAGAARARAEVPNSATDHAPPPRDVADLKATRTEPRPLRGKLRLPLLITGLLALTAAVVLGARWWFRDLPDPSYSCLALEDASEDDLAAHWARESGTPLPRPPARANAEERSYTISDPPDGGPVQSIWTTSKYSYVERRGPSRPGGGRADFRLRVGGWGDTYLSLLKVPVPTNRLVQKAVIQLTVLGDDPTSRPTSMTLRATGDSWSVRPGPDNRMWWQDCPGSDIVRRHLPPPGARDTTYEIEITDLYNMWASGFSLPYGIILEPEHIGSWGPGRPHYANFSTFYSTRASDHEKRPRLILTY